MSSNYLQEAIKQDWDNRDYIEGISISILKIAEFLNKFGTLNRCNILNSYSHLHEEQNTRVKLGELNQKLTNLERKMEYVEAAVHSVQDVRQQQ